MITQSTRLSFVYVSIAGREVRTLAAMRAIHHHEHHHHPG
jgi:hypothetical protein